MNQLMIKQPNIIDGNKITLVCRTPNYSRDKFPDTKLYQNNILSDWGMQIKKKLEIF